MKKERERKKKTAPENYITKYPRPLAETETKSRRNYREGEFQVTPETDKDLLTDPAAFSLQNIYPYIFDGLAALCTDCADMSREYEIGGAKKTLKVIQGQDEEGLLYYQTILPVDIFRDFALNGHNESWQYLEVELYEMFKKPERRLLPFAPGLLFATHPIQVDFIYEDGIKASTIKKLENIGADRKIKYLVLHFYKPLFASILQKNKKGGIGSNYLQIPRALQAEINAMLKRLKNHYIFCKEHCVDMQKIHEWEIDHDFENVLKNVMIEFNIPGEPSLAKDYTDKIKEYTERLEAVMSLSAIEARKIFLFLACHDDRQSAYISIKTYEDNFLIGCFPRLVEIRKKTGKVYIKPKNKELLNKKLQGFTYLFGIMAREGKLNGAQFLPLDFDFLNKRVKVQRNKSLCYNNQPELNFIK